MLVNLTKKKTISLDVEFASNPLRRFLGVMFRKRLSRPVIFIFPREGRISNAIHSFFVFFSFTAIFLDEKKKVVDVRRVRPFTPLLVPKAPARYLIELPQEMAEGIEVGDELSF